MDRIFANELAKRVSTLARLKGNWVCTAVMDAEHLLIGLAGSSEAEPEDVQRAIHRASRALDAGILVPGPTSRLLQTPQLKLEGSIGISGQREEDCGAFLDEAVQVFLEHETITAA